MDNKSKKDIAKIYYVNHNRTQAEISQVLGVSEVTVSKWKKDGKWDVLKAAQATRNDEIISRAYDQINRILKNAEDADRELTDGESDRIAKIAKSIQNLETKATLSHVIEISEELLLFIKEVDQPLAIKVADMFMQFTSKKAEQYNGRK